MACLESRKFVPALDEPLDRARQSCIYEAKQALAAIYAGTTHGINNSGMDIAVVENAMTLSRVVIHISSVTRRISSTSVGIARKS
jgi:hypothetical protein